MKTCTKCGFCKLDEFFSKDSCLKSGLQSWCKKCVSDYDKNYSRINCQKKRLAATKWQKEHKEIVNLKNKKWGDKNKEKLFKCKKSYREANREKERSYGREYSLANPEKGAARSSKHRAYKLKATPKWANQFFIEEIYDLAQRRTKVMGHEWHVDHIIPLNHELVCGLHCEHNLQVIPAMENLSKGNAFYV